MNQELSNVYKKSILLLSEWENEFNLSITHPIINAELEFDNEGYLVNLNAWSPLVCLFLAKKDKHQLTKEHWQIISFLRCYYEVFQIIPAVRVLTKAIAKCLDEKKGNSKYLYLLFPYGPSKQAGKYAGIPRPTSYF
jgi:tRNA 2-thiouridine synthesizing protein E